MNDDQKPGWKVWVEKSADYGRSSRMAITHTTIDDLTGRAVPRLAAIDRIELRQIGESERLPDFLRGEDMDGFLQAALDAAWEAGMRPSTMGPGPIMGALPIAGKERSLGEGNVLLVLRVSCIKCGATKDAPFAIDGITLTGPAAIEPCRTCGGSVFRCG